MKVAFAGTPDFARVALAQLHAAGFRDSAGADPAGSPGRSRHAAPGFAGQGVGRSSTALPLAQPRSLRLDGRFADDAERARAALQAAEPDVLVVAAYGLLLPDWVLALPPLGCLNIHASLLPRWRGAAPIHRAIEAGDAETGITIMQMDAGLDTGDMLRTRRRRRSARRHHRHPARPPGRARRAADRRGAGRSGAQVSACCRCRSRPTGVTYAHKVDKAGGGDRLDAAGDCHRAPPARVRPFSRRPPPCWTAETIKCWRGRVVPGGGAPGEVVDRRRRRDRRRVRRRRARADPTAAGRAGAGSPRGNSCKRTPVAVGAKFTSPI